MKRSDLKLEQNLWVLAPAVLIFILVFTFLIHTALGENRIGADYYIFWRAGKALFVDHQNPYSQEVMHQTQIDILGRSAGPREDNLAFVYPLYSLFGMLPNIFLPYDWALSLWYASNLVALLSLLYAIFVEKAKNISVTVLLFYPILFGLVMGNFAIPVGIAILFFFGLLVQRGKDGLSMQIIAGILLAWATLKPQFVWLSCIFALIYAIRQRWYPFLAAFITSLAFFILASWIILPGWVAKWLHFVSAYATYQQIAPSLVEILRSFLPLQAADVIGWAILGLCLVAGMYWMVLWWRGGISWGYVLVGLGLLTYLIHPHGLSYEQIPAFIPLILWISEQGLNSKEKRFFWWSSLLISWIPLIFYGSSTAVDRSPILWLVVWAGWLFFRKEKQSRKVATAFTV